MFVPSACVSTPTWRPASGGVTNCAPGGAGTARTTSASVTSCAVMRSALTLGTCGLPSPALRSVMRLVLFVRERHQKTTSSCALAIRTCEEIVDDAVCAPLDNSSTLTPEYPTEAPEGRLAECCAAMGASQFVVAGNGIHRSGVRVMAQLAEYTSSRELLWNLTLRELRGRYKRSVLGWTWSLLNPLSSVVIFSVVFGFFFQIKPPVGDPSGLHNFAVFLLCGLLSWN